MPGKLFILIVLWFTWLFPELSVTETKNIRVLNFNQFEQNLHFRNDTVYLVNFWATWCAPCVAELPAIEAVGKKYQYQKFKILLVSLDLPKQLNSRLIPFLLSKKIKSDVILLDDPDQNNWIEKVNADWSGEIPFTLIYGKDFRSAYAQSFSYETLDSIVNLKIHLP
ncbi:MAG: TlpA family protein disulfide reductase [Prolixibacteraceae bacterium]